MKSLSNSLKDIEIITLAKNHDERGSITAIEDDSLIGFKPKRVFYLYDIPGGASRGGHAHKELFQCLVAASGSFSVEMKDGQDTRIFSLNRPDKALVIPPGIWASELDFSSGSICLVVCSHSYDEADYIRSYDDYLAWRLS